MNAIAANLREQAKADPAAMDSLRARLLARVVQAEREFAEGKYRPARDVIADLKAKNRT